MDTNQLYDLVVIGAGPAGLSGAIYMARARYKTLVLEKDHIGGQIAYTSEVVNYPGVYETSGEKLTKEMAKQVESFGGEIKMDEVVELKLDQPIKEIKTKTTTYKALAVMLATGVTPRILGFKGEQEFKGRGIAYCATCDGEFFTGKDIFVVGGGLAAAEEAMFLTRFGKSVTMIVREPELICPNPIMEKVYNHKPEIKVMKNCVVDEVSGSTYPNKIQYHNTETNEVHSYEVDDVLGVFIFSGYLPNNALFKDQVKLDARGYVESDSTLQTNLRGVYVAGDLGIKTLRQVITASSDGALAATNAISVIDELHKELDLPPFEVKQKQISKQEKSDSQANSTSGGQFIDGEMHEQLQSVFNKINQDIVLEAHINNSELSKEMRVFLKELSAVSSFIKTEIYEDLQEGKSAYLTLKGYPYTFYGIPGGHEFTSFVLAIYHLMGPEKPMDENVKAELAKIEKPIHLDVIVSLTCTKCPGLVNTVTQMMRHSKHLSLAVHDINHNEFLKDKYHIMSVPCIVVNEDKVDFGLKDFDGILSLIK